MPPVAGVPKYSFLLALGATALLFAGKLTMEWLPGSRAVFAGYILGVFGIDMMIREVWIIGFDAGVKSVPLDGAGLASGDARAFDDGHRWNAELGAWEKCKGDET